MSSTTPDATPGRSFAKNRSMMKCELCRIKKLKCLPEDRDFSLKPRCDACVKSNASCGPNTRVFRKPAQSPAITTAPTPLTTCISPEISSAEYRNDGSTDFGQRTGLGQEGSSFRSTLSSSQVNFNASTSHCESDQTIQIHPAEPPYQRAIEELVTIGRLIQLREFCLQRHQAIFDMQRAWPLIDIHLFAASLDVLIAAIANLILNSFRYVRQLQLQCTRLEQELLTRRLFDTGQQFLRSTPSHELESGKILSFEELLKGIRRDLVDLYQKNGDYAEASRISSSCCDTYTYLTGHNMKTLSQLADELRNILQVAFKDINTSYRRRLDPLGELRICASHLAILCGRQRDTISPSSCGVSMGTEITGRNELHLAVEIGDLPFLSWAINARKRRGEISLEDRDRLGLTPLMIAAYTGEPEVFQLLLDEGADLKSQHPSGRSILCLASMAGHVGIMAQIFARGVKIQDCIQFCSPIHDAASCGRSEEVIQILLEHKAEPRDERTDHGNRCASQVALEGQHDAIAKILQDAEMKLEQQLPIKNDHAQAIQSLKRLISDEMARSKSPESPASSRPPNARFVSPDRGRARKRHKSSRQDWDTIVVTALSASSTPRCHANTPVVPSPLAQTLVDPYNGTTLSDVEPDVLHGTLDEYMLAPDARYSPFMEDEFS